MKFTIITTDSNNVRSEYTTRSLKQAHAIYDKAVNSGIYVEQFSNGYGSDMRDRQQEVSTMQWTKEA